MPTATPLLPPPGSLGLDPFYKKYLDADGLPIVSSAEVPDAALFRARDIIDEMLVNRPDLRATIAEMGVRVAIMAELEVTTDIPEHSDLYEAFPSTDWNARARGLSATRVRPATSAAEENLLCYGDDVYRNEDILVHEFAHTVLQMGVEQQPKGTAFRTRLESAYEDALDAGLWAGTYAAENTDEYWAEAVQSWFGVNDWAIPTNGIHNHINTRHELEAYDPRIADLIEEVFGETTISSTCHTVAITPPPGAQPSYVVDNTGLIEITPIGRGVSVTSENQILVELEPGDIVSANPFDLAGRTLVFTPDGRGGYSRAVQPLNWDPDDRGERPRRPVEIELKHFQFDFSGQKWRSFFLSPTGLITFGKAFPNWRSDLGAVRFGTMRMIADAMVVTPTISALYKPYLGGYIYVSDLPDRVVITFYAWDSVLAVYGRRPKETFNYQIVLHSDGRVAFNYGPDPADPDEAFRDGIVGLFPTDLTTEVIPRIPDPGADLSRPDSGFSAAQSEVFRYPAIRDRGEGVADVSCRIIEVLGDEFDFFAFNSQFRVDQQERGPAHGFGGYYWGNQTATGFGREPERDRNRVTPCKSRLTNSWGFPVWMKAGTVVYEPFASRGHHTPYDEGLTYFAHEIGHTWLAFASYLVNGQRTPMQESGYGHWTFGLHAPAPFPWDGAENGSIMGGAFWRENPDGTFSPTVGWWTKAGGFSWLDLYLMGLATPEEVPDMFILRNLQQLTSDPRGPYAAEKEIITIEQVIAASGPRNPPAARARKVFNIGFVYFLLPGQTPDPELLREHADYRDRALDHWRHVTGGRGQLTTEIP